MNKVFNINLGGYPFTIDEDAYEHLRSYLKTIHKHFQQSEGYEEITSDIETRLAELFQEKLSGRPIVTISTVKDAIAIMGTPQDFGASPLDEEDIFAEEPKAEKQQSYQRTRNTSEGINYKTGKRLFRNPDDEVVGGVCSGVAAYFGIEDPVWVRLGFAIFFFAGGFALPLYLILWAVMPVAETAADRLAMRGEPITASNIGKIVEEEMEKFGEQMTEFGEDINEKFGSGNRKKKKSHDVNASTTNGKAALVGALAYLGSILKFVLALVPKIIRPILFIIGIALIVALTSSGIAAIVSLFFGQPYLSYVFPEQMFIANVGIGGLFLLVAMFLVSCLFSLSPILFGRSVHRFLRRGAVAVSILSAIAFFGAGSYLVKDFKAHGSVEMSNTNVANTNVLQVVTEKKYHNDDNDILRISEGNFEALVDAEQLIIKNIDVFFKKGEGKDIVISKEIASRGKSITESKALAQEINYPSKIEGNVLVLPTYFTLPKGVKYRGQKVNIDVYIPEGKSFVLDDSRGYLPYHINGENGYFLDKCEQWTRVKDEFTCTDLNSKIERPEEEVETEIL